jgi:hypothetical protein
MRCRPTCNTHLYHQRDDIPRCQLCVFEGIISRAALAGHAFNHPRELHHGWSTLSRWPFGLKSPPDEVLCVVKSHALQTRPNSLDTPQWTFQWLLLSLLFLFPARESSKIVKLRLKIALVDVSEGRMTSVIEYPRSFHCIEQVGG